MPVIPAITATTIIITTATATPIRTITTAADPVPDAPLFDVYLMVDWSAAAVPRLGKDSIWVYRLERSGGRLKATARRNVATRLAARALLLALLRESLAAGRSILAGFDFPFGYPQGFAARLGLPGPPWRAVWDLLAAELVEEAENGNNRFAVAARLNQRLGGAAPFWGCPRAAAGRFLGMTHHRQHAAMGLAEHRLADRRLSGPQPVWKLAGAGSAGSQALTGIPVVRWLRDHPTLARATRVWPFETGLALPPRGTRGRVVLTEIYPSLVPAAERRGEVRDSAQVRAIARHFAALDDTGRLASLFAGDPTLTAAERQAVEREEGWVLGSTGAPRRYSYLRKPAAIYRRSFALIRRETDLSSLPRALHPLALRLVHAAGEPALARDLAWSPGAAEAGRAALAAGAPILVDAAMVAAGIIAVRLPRRNQVLCFLGDRRVPGLARRLGTTRSAAAVELWRPHLAGAIVALGNAPTALFHLLEIIAGGAPLPALVLGFPVGFVGAAEAKAALAENRLGLAFVALAGRRGGSALAAAAVNALAGERP
jgi:precorrin-8X/cobalt-precorrin-8 methylmutase